MLILNIPEEFSTTTGFRTYDDGPKSGLEFFEELLDSRFEEAQQAEVKLKIILDGGEGYTSSFLNESFRLLSEKYTADVVWNNIIIISEEWPKYIQKIKEAIYE
ncbi:MAG: STAS-like domain-containing protein [Flavobacteriaceae bacterium]|nr:STAS-like domain-containing protein [Flavobacteriaceae bacterium]